MLGEITELALRSQYACGHISFLTVRIVGNMKEAVTDRRTDGRTERQTDGNVGNIYGCDQCLLSPIYVTLERQCSLSHVKEKQVVTSLLLPPVSAVEVITLHDTLSLSNGTHDVLFLHGTTHPSLIDSTLHCVPREHKSNGTPVNLCSFYFLMHKYGNLLLEKLS